MWKFLWAIFKGSNENNNFWSHVDELRRRIIISLLFLILFSVLAFFFKNFIFDNIILSQTKSNFVTYKVLCKLNNIFPSLNLCFKPLFNFQIINTEVGGQFRYHLILSIVTGLIIASPFIFYQLWLFIKPSLYRHEFLLARKYVFYLTLLFLIGISFGYFVVSPITLNFLLSYELSSIIKNMISISSFVSTITILSFSMGLVFELPMMILLLTKLRIVTPEFLRKQRKLALIIIFIIAGFITPSTDIFSQVLVGLPFYILFEISILVSQNVKHKNIS